MNFSKIVKDRPIFRMFREQFDEPTAYGIAKYSKAHKRHFIEDIDASDTYCLDKGRLCWALREIQFQTLFCLKCGDYLLSQTDEPKTEKLYCACACPLEDLHGNAMMELEWYGKTGTKKP